MSAVAAVAETLHAAHDRAWRSPRAVAAHWAGADQVDPRLLVCDERGAFWATLAERGLTLLVTREYEHLVIALHPGRREPLVSYLPLPHPSGLAVDRRRGVVHVACTRNPNQIVELVPARGMRAPGARAPQALADRPLVPAVARFLPGATYLHDLAMIGGTLHANSVGANAILRIDRTGRTRRVWWPKSVETARGPRYDRNLLQLNSIAAGRTLRDSFFTASAERPGLLPPGHPDFPVDRRGVLFSGASRTVVVRGLTRPHSARLRRGRVWLANSGYGELGVCEGERFVPIATPGGWTRGLAFAGDVAFVGTSRVLPRFHQYAPGLDPARCVCGVHAVDVRSGRVLGSLIWPFGNQIFAIAAVPDRFTRRLPIVGGGRDQPVDEQTLFYGFTT
jgi:uncharacterized protein (TIGR03032 family)